MNPEPQKGESLEEYLDKGKQVKPVKVEETYVPQFDPKTKTTVQSPGLVIGEILVWKGWKWVLLEANEKGQALFQCHGPTTNHLLRAQGEERRFTRHMKKMRKRERIAAKIKMALKAGSRK